MTEKKGSVAMTEVKKNKDRKRHILVDHLGLLISAEVSAGNCGDRDGLQVLLYFCKDKYPS